VQPQDAYFRPIPAIATAQWVNLFLNLRPSC
jgi:hypothetical protein